MKIGILDSGIGGLTILKKLMAVYPHHEYIYFGDTINMPYGTKKKEEIIEYAQNIINFLESENVDIIVIACGTLSSNISFLKSPKKLIDVISPLKGKLDKYKEVSIIATPLSIQTNAYQKFIKTQLNLIAAPLLVPLIESNNLEDIDDILKEYLKSTKNSDSLLLGCTHYPIIKEKFTKYFKKDIICLEDFIVDEITNLTPSKPSLRLYFSYVDAMVKENVYRILENHNLDIERRDVHVK